MDEIGIASYNCNGLADSKKRRTIFCLQCLQETHSTKEDEVSWAKQYYFSHGQRNSKGVMILIKNQVQFKVCSVG